MRHGEVVLENFVSAILRENPVGDPAERQVPVYLPPGYEAPGRRYPVIFALTGFTGRGTMLLNRSGFGLALDQRLDHLIAGGLIEPVVVVMPDCFTRYGGSQYLDSPATGNYESHLIHELIPFIDEKYRTEKRREKRAVMGKSSGGYGAMVLGLRHPDTFGVVACHSGDMAFEYCYLPDFPAAMIELEKHGGIAGFLEDFDRQPKKKPESMAALNILAMAAAYSPNPQKPPHWIDLPFDPRTGALREEVWQRWLAWDPVRMLAGKEAVLRKTKIFLDCGTRDEWRLYAGARMFSHRLDEAGIPHVYEEFDDTHMDIMYRYDRSLQFISRAFHE